MMHSPFAAKAAAVSVIVAILAFPLLGPAVAALLGLTLLTVGILVPRTGALRGSARLSRRSLFVSGLLLGLIGLAFQGLLVANRSDNAYLWIWAIGVVVTFLAVPFLLAACAPSAWRPGLSRAATFLLWLVAVPSVVLLAAGGLIYLMSSGPLPGAAGDNRVAANHLVSTVALLVALWVLGYWVPHIADRSRARSSG